MKDKKCEWIELARIIFDFLVLVVAGFALYSNFKANLISRQANNLSQNAIDLARRANELSETGLARSTIPWLQINDLTCKLTDASTLTFMFNIKNFSNSPALDLHILPSIANYSDIWKSLQSPAVMPGDSQKLSLSIETKAAKEMYETISRSERNAKVGFRLTYNDVSGKGHEVFISYLWANGYLYRDGYAVVK